MFVQTHHQRNRQTSAASLQAPIKTRPRQSKCSDCPTLDNKQYRSESIKDTQSTLMSQAISLDGQKTVSFGSNFRRAGAEKRSLDASRFDFNRQRMSRKSEQSFKNCLVCSECYKWQYSCINSSCPIKRQAFSVACEDICAKAYACRQCYTEMMTYGQQNGKELRMQDGTNNWFRQKRLSYGCNKPELMQKLHSNSFSASRSLIRNGHNLTEETMRDNNTSINSNLVSYILKYIGFYIWLLKCFCLNLITYQAKSFRLMLEDNAIDIQPRSGVLIHQSYQILDDSRVSYKQAEILESDSAKTCSSGRFNTALTPNDLPESKTTCKQQSRVIRGLSCDSYAKSPSKRNRIHSDGDVVLLKDCDIEEHNPKLENQQLENNTIAENSLDTTSGKRRLSLTGAKRRIGFTDKKTNHGRVDPGDKNSLSQASFRLPAPEITISTMTESGTFDESVCQISAHILPKKSTNEDIADAFGAGQMLVHQALISSQPSGILLALTNARGMLEVSVIQVRNLKPRMGDKNLPSPYVKVYLIRDKKCVAKCKTDRVAQTLDPTYQQKFIIRENHTGCVLQVIVWGDCKKKDRKWLMGIVQINLDEVDISKNLTEWYRLFDSTSTTGSMVSSKTLRRMMLP